MRFAAYQIRESAAEDQHGEAWQSGYGEEDDDSKRGEPVCVVQVAGGELERRCAEGRPEERRAAHHQQPSPVDAADDISVAVWLARVQ